MSRYFPTLAEMKKHELVKGIVGHLTWGEKLMLSYVEIAPGTGVAMHSHPHEQAGFIVEGEMEFTIGGEKRRLQRGDFFFVPGGMPHTGTSGPKGAVVLDVFAPPREEYK